MRREALEYDGMTVGNFDSDLKYWDQSRYTDWQDVLIGGSSKVADLQASVTSGSEFTSFRFGGGFHKETLVFPGDFGYHKASGQLSMNHSSDDRKFKLSASATYGFEDNKLFAQSLVSIALTLAPNAPQLKNEDGTLNWEPHDFGGFTDNTWINPLSYLEYTQNVSAHNLLSNAIISYEILPKLSILTSGGYTHFLNEEHVKNPIGGNPPDYSGRQILGSANFSDVSRKSWIIEPKITYSKVFGLHNLDLIVGTTLQRSMSENTITTGQNYSSDALLNSLKGAGVISSILDENIDYKYMSTYGRIGYDWNRKYLLNLTGRRDGSSRFGPNNQFGNFGALGAAWIFSEEIRVKKALPTLAFGKLRGSYGITGSDAVKDYSFYDLYSILGTNYQGVPGFSPTALYNPNFFWESTRKLEAALELGFWENKFGFEISWYRNRSSNQLIDYALPAMSGFSSILSNFDATVQNTGWEGVLRAIVYNSSQFKWNISFNISVPKNKLLRFNGIEDSPYVNVFKVGEPLSIQWLYVANGVNSKTGLYEFVDFNNDNTINDLDRRLTNSTDRKYYGGLNNWIRYRNFELSTLIQYSNQPGFQYLPRLPGSLGTNQSISVLDRWYAPGESTKVQRFSSGNGDSVGADAFVNYVYLQQSTSNREDASFIRLKAVSLSYSLPFSLVKKAGMQQAKIMVYGQNLLTITRYTSLDPETGSGLPPLRMITAGLQISL